MAKDGKIYLSRKFYAGRPLSILEPDVELEALNSLKETLLQREEYEKVELVQNRINELIMELELRKMGLQPSYGSNAADTGFK